MLTKEAVFGHIVWLTEAEINDSIVIEEIKRLKSLGRVAIFCSGNIEPVQILNKLLQENLEQISL